MAARGAHVVAGLLALLLIACGSDEGGAMLSGEDLGLDKGAGPDGSYFAQPPDSAGRNIRTRWPVLFSHAWSRIADTSFQGDEPHPVNEFERYGVKKALEAEGVVVYQPDKLAFASHERRGRLLYKKCAGGTIDEILCEGADPQVVDGVHAATIDYCSRAELRVRNGFADEQSCREGLQFNIICHSQGCADSRYMMAAVRNAFSGELMYRHVASWTSMAGANKGTAQADAVQELLLACAQPRCRSLVLDAAFGIASLIQNQALILEGGESVVALTRKYMTVTTDMKCDPQEQACPPSFNERYPLPEDPGHPVLYQSFTSQIDDINHPCYADNRLYWEIVREREGPNDGNISVDSQRFTTYGPGDAGAPTPVIPRWVSATSNDPARPHPGLDHMAYSSSEVPGMEGVSCLGEDNSAFAFSRVGLYRGIVAELAGWGY
ncbi:hypothetical protein [Algiphilus sp.]|uniref:hypothetical protein n=1 Tax=Algiphilus sp. TaxID=1872431 RepID=UPI0025B7B5FC|nr:hypothetical protein [Algiphilus sp.]MCK5769881.1 hypothetical protein [Algiphilus sp.]